VPPKGPKITIKTPKSP